MHSAKIFLAVIFNEIKCHVNTSLGLVGGIHPLHPPCVDAWTAVSRYFQTFPVVFLCAESKYKHESRRKEVFLLQILNKMLGLCWPALYR